MSKLIQESCSINRFPAPALRQERLFVNGVEQDLPNGGKAGLLFITTCPPRECGIATYTQDLITAIRNKFSQSFAIIRCPVVGSADALADTIGQPFVLVTGQPAAFPQLARSINNDPSIDLVVIQHEFGLFAGCRDDFNVFAGMLEKPVLLVFHTVLTRPSPALLQQVRLLAGVCTRVMVMTHTSSGILQQEYGIGAEKISVIPHGTHLVLHADGQSLKQKYSLTGRKVLTTFGLLSAGKGIETTLDALPAIVALHPDVIFLIIGKTHPSVIRTDGEQYRVMLELKVKQLHLEPFVRFVNYFLPLPELLEYLQLTDIYLFTSLDPHQAVSGTFSYAISCGCPVISTPIPHAREVLKSDGGVLIDFGNKTQLEEAVILLLQQHEIREQIIFNGLHRMAATSWENAAIAHAGLFNEMLPGQRVLRYTIPPLNTGHIRKMTTGLGIYQFSKLNKPDPAEGYTLDDNARALIALVQHYAYTREPDDVGLIATYLRFIGLCQQADGSFLNYMDQQGEFTLQNQAVNLDDANGRAVWALGYLIAHGDILPADLSVKALAILRLRLISCDTVHSTRAMAFYIKGIYYKVRVNMEKKELELIRLFADRLVQMYKHESDAHWKWFEGYLTYANSVLPEALLCAWQATGELKYKETAKASFDFLLSRTFHENRIRVISNKNWLHDRQGIQEITRGGEQPIDVAYTILALKRFSHVFRDQQYQDKMRVSFNWFLGANHLQQIMYNPCTGGCYDGLEQNYVNLNQGAESTVSYLMARLSLPGTERLSARTEEHIDLSHTVYETRFVEAT